MARPTLPRALVVDRTTPMQSGGDVTADLLLEATLRISQAAERIIERAEETPDLIDVVALASYIGDVNDKFMSYFDRGGDRFPLFELAHTIFPRFDHAEEALNGFLVNAAEADAAKVEGASASAREIIANRFDKVEPVAAATIRTLRAKARQLSDLPLIVDHGEVQTVLDHAVDLLDDAANASVEIAPTLLLNACAFIIASQALMASIANGDDDQASGSRAAALMLSDLHQEVNTLHNEIDRLEIDRSQRAAAAMKPAAQPASQREAVAA